MAAAMRYFFVRPSPSLIEVARLALIRFDISPGFFVGVDLEFRCTDSVCGLTKSVYHAVGLV